LINYNKQVDRKFTAYSGMSLDDMKNSASDVLAQTSQASYDAMMAQSMIGDIEGDESDLEDLQDTSDNSEGALDVAQATNNILALNTSQLMRLQTITAASARLQASQYEEQVQRKLITEADSQSYTHILIIPLILCRAAAAAPALWIFNNLKGACKMKFNNTFLLMLASSFLFALVAWTGRRPSNTTIHMNRNEPRRLNNAGK